MIHLQNVFADVAGGAAFTIMAAGVIIIFGVVIAGIVVVSLLIIKWIKKKNANK